MAKKLYEESSVQDIAAAIREKNGTATKYKVAEMAGQFARLSHCRPILRNTAKLMMWFPSIWPPQTPHTPMETGVA